MCKNKKELDEAVAKFTRLTAEKKKAEAELTKVKAEIAEYAKAKGQKGGKDGNTYIVFGKNYKISCIPIEQEKFDGNALRSYLGDFLPAFLKKSLYWRIDIR